MSKIKMFAAWLVVLSVTVLVTMSLGTDPAWIALGWMIWHDMKEEVIWR